MENFDKILELLEKRKLTFEEEKELDSLRKDKQSADFISGYLQVKDALNLSHISTDDLADYILYEKGNSDKDISYRLPAIGAHLKECRICSVQLNELRDEYQNIEGFLADNLYSDSKANQPAAVHMPVNKLYPKGFRPLYAMAGVFVVGLIYVVLLAVSGITTPDNYKYAAITDLSEDYLTRGRNTELFLKSFEAIESENYPRAVEYLKQDIRHNINDETIFYSYYVLGLTYLEMSESRVLGLFPSYDHNYAVEGINNLQRSVDLNTSGRFDNIKLDAYFYLAKGNLMLNKEKTAKDYLKLVISQKGGKMNEAAGILNELE